MPHRWLRHALPTDPHAAPHHHLTALMYTSTFARTGTADITLPDGSSTSTSSLKVDETIFCGDQRDWLWLEDDEQLGRRPPAYADRVPSAARAARLRLLLEENPWWVETHRHSPRLIREFQQEVSAVLPGQGFSRSPLCSAHEKVRFSGPPELGRRGRVRPKKIIYSGCMSGCRCRLSAVGVRRANDVPWHEHEHTHEHARTLNTCTHTTTAFGCLTLAGHAAVRRVDWSSGAGV